MSATANLGLAKPAATDYYSVDTQNTNADKIDAAIGDNSEMKPAGGTSTAITLAIPSVLAYRAYQKITFIASANNSGAATTIKANSLAAMPLYKPATTTAPNLIAGKAYEVWVGASVNCFFIKASAEGTAIQAQVLAGVPFSNEIDSGLVGTMPENGAVTITPSAVDQAIALGYHNGSGKVKAVTVPAAKVLNDTTIAGTPGQMANKGAVIIIPSGSDQPIAAGYHNGSGKVSAVMVPTAKVLNDTTIAGQQGTMVNRSGGVHVSASQINVGVLSGGDTNNNAYMLPPTGYYDGTSWVKYPQPDLLSINILANKSILGIIGGLTDIPYLAGDVIMASNDAQGYYARGTALTKHRAISIPIKGTIRVSFDFSVGSSATSNISHGQIYINGIARGTIRTATGKDQSFVTYTEDFTVNAGDLVQLYMWNDSADMIATSRNFRIKSSRVVPLPTVTLGA